ncbi:CdaR family transcriptional regulator [Streptomyces sp. MUM 16J]|uniref:PucR family transcriptional regulator n=1 Tax=Streptomyces sp. MUM 16J TaxID=2791988 RepID=UPI001F037AF7|nr:PucR family transcriptional regulator [Streptomyces sp. MUM 16J]MCH0556914.1 helix-turn-helix domain-containing protein [Streptomyces sp. MUM 16J]
MTDDPPHDAPTDPYASGPRGISDAARALAARCEPLVNETARRMSHDSFARIPGYPDLPVDVKDLEIAATARHGLRQFVQRVQTPYDASRDPHEAEGDPYGTDDAYALFRERAAQRAEEGMPLPVLLRSHVLGAYVLWEMLHEVAGPGEEAALAELSGLLLRVQEGVVGAVTEAYLQQQAFLDEERREELRSVVRGLLDGSLPPNAASVRGLGLDGGGLVLCLRGPQSAPTAGTVGSTVAERRREGRLQTTLDRGFGTRVLTLFEDGGGYAVVPGRGAGGPPEVPAGLADRLRRAWAGEVRAAIVSVAGAGDVPDAARTAAEIVRVAAASGLPPGLHRIEDVLFEFHLAHDSEAGPLIAAVLDPLARRPELVETLRTYLDCNLDRRSTAHLLGLHPNTVDNRIARVTQLTGLDLAVPRSAAVALCALLLREWTTR